MPPTDREFDLILAQIRELRETLATSNKELRDDINRFEKCLAQRRGAEKAGVWLLGLIFSALGGAAQFVISRL